MNSIEFINNKTSTSFWCKKIVMKKMKADKEKIQIIFANPLLN